MALLLLTLAGCSDGTGLPQPDRLRQPSGLLLAPDGRWLFVTNGNWTLDEAGASVMAIDLTALDHGLARPGDAEDSLDRSRPCRWTSAEDDPVIECDPSLLVDRRHTVVVGSAAGNIALDLPRGADGPWRLLIPTRSPPSVAWIDVFPDEGYLHVDCGQDELSRCDAAHAVTRHASDPQRSMPADPSRVFVDELGFRYAYVPHLRGGNLSLLALDGELGPELTDIAEEFYREDPFEDLDLAGGFSVAERACTTGNAAAQTEDCSRPLLFTTHRFWPGVRQFAVAPGLDVVVGHGNRTLVDLNPNVVQQRPFMGDLAFEDPDRGERLLVVHTTPAGLSRIDTRLDDRQTPYVDVRATVELCDNPNLLRVYRPAQGEPLALVSCFSDRALAVVALGSFTLQAIVEVGEGPNEMAVDAPRQRLYVANSREDSLSVVDLDRTHATFLHEVARIGLGVAR